MHFNNTDLENEILDFNALNIKYCMVQKLKLQHHLQNKN